MKEEVKTLHARIVAVLESVMMDEAGLMPGDVLEYFKTATEGLRVSMAFQPTRETFVNNLRFE